MENITVKNKSQAKKVLKSFGNKVMILNGFAIAKVCWFQLPWMIIRQGETFDQVSDRSYKAQAEFLLRDQLLDRIFA